MCVTFSICNFILKNILKPIFGSQHLSIRKHTIIHKFMTYSQDLPLCKLCLKSTFVLTTWLCFLYKSKKRILTLTKVTLIYQNLNGSNSTLTYLLFP